jgi:Ser/Thr protein kinase RdoA (MazF antagonist)
MDERRLERFLRRHVRERLLAPRGLGEAEFRLTAPETGVTTLVRLVELDGDPGFALRVYPGSRRWRARRRMAAEQLIERHDLPAPRVVDCRFGLRFGGLTVVAEERLAGRHLGPGEWTAGRAGKLGEALARLHAVSSSRHGPVEKPSRRSFFTALQQRVDHRLKGIRRRDDRSLSKEQLAEVQSWFRAWEAPFQRLDRFDLTHDKLNPGNVLWQEELHRVALLDFETLQFGCRAKDLAQACHDVLFDEQRAVAAFLEAYWERVPAEARASAEGLCRFFRAYVHLGQCSVNLRRAAKARPKRDPKGELRKFARHWASLSEIVKTPPDVVP